MEYGFRIREEERNAGRFITGLIVLIEEIRRVKPFLQEDSQPENLQYPKEQIVSLHPGLQAQ